MNAADTAETNALYVTPEGAFDRGLPPIPAHRFDAERERALDPATPTGIILLDLSAALNIDWPATTPELLARYLVIRPGERLSHRFQATGEMHYVLKGAGRSTSGGVTLEWRAGDGFCFPGGAETVHQADEDTLIVSTTDEPHHRHFRTQPVPASESFLLPAVFRQDRIDAALGLVHVREGPVKTAGKYVTFSTGGDGPDGAGHADADHARLDQHARGGGRAEGAYPQRRGDHRIAAGRGRAFDDRRDADRLAALVGDADPAAPAAFPPQRGDGDDAQLRGAGRAAVLPPAGDRIPVARGHSGLTYPH